MPDYYFELRHQQLAAMQAALAVFERSQRSSSALSGRRYRSLEPYALDGAEHAIVCLGSTGGTVKDVVDELRAKASRSACSSCGRSARSRATPARRRSPASPTVSCSTAPTRRAARRRSSPRSRRRCTARRRARGASSTGSAAATSIPEEIRAVFDDERPARTSV